MATSGAPSRNICRVMPTPTVPSSTAEARRERVNTMPSTDIAMMANGMRSHHTSRPSARGAGVTPSMPSVSTITHRPIAVTDASRGNRWRDGLKPSASEPSCLPKSERPRVVQASTSVPSAGRRSLFSSAAKTRLRKNTTNTTPATKTARDTRNGGVTPCQRARWVAKLSSPVTARTPAETGLSTQNSTNGRTAEVRPGSAAGSQRAVGASWTSGRSFGPSINAPKTIFAEYTKVRNAAMPATVSRSAP